MIILVSSRLRRPSCSATTFQPASWESTCTTSRPTTTSTSTSPSWATRRRAAAWSGPTSSQTSSKTCNLTPSITNPGPCTSPWGQTTDCSASSRRQRGCNVPLVPSLLDSRPDCVFLECQTKSKHLFFVYQFGWLMAASSVSSNSASQLAVPSYQGVQTGCLATIILSLWTRFFYLCQFTTQVYNVPEHAVLLLEYFTLWLIDNHQHSLHVLYRFGYTICLTPHQGVSCHHEKRREHRSGRCECFSYVFHMLTECCWLN